MNAVLFRKQGGQAQEVSARPIDRQGPWFILLKNSAHIPLDR